MRSIVRCRHSWAFPPPAYIRYYMNTWLLKRFVLVGYFTIWQSLKQASCRLVQRNVGNYKRAASKDVYKIVTGANHGSMRMSPGQNNSPACGSVNPSQIQWNLFVKKSLRSTWSPVSSAKVIMWRLFHLSIVGWSILGDAPQFVCVMWHSGFRTAYNYFWLLINKSYK